MNRSDLMAMVLVIGVVASLFERKDGSQVPVLMKTLALAIACSLLIGHDLVPAVRP